MNGGLRRQLICLALILNLLIWPGPNLIAQQIPVMASTSVEYTTVAARTISDFFKWLFSRSKTQRAGHLTSADRRARVARIRINPAKFVGYEGQQVVFTAFPTDASDEPAQGIRFDWSSSNPEKVKIDEAGRATFMQAGLAWITCSIGAARALVPVLVRQGRRPMQSDSDWRSDQNRLNADGATTSTTSWIPNLLDKLVPTAYAQGQTQGDFLWNDIRNLVGSPRNRVVEFTRVGPVLPEQNNYNLNAPILSLAGRGLNLNLTLSYNSRCWFMNGSSSIYYSPLPGFPRPGFNLGFGYIVTYMSSSPPYDTAYLFIDVDGTPRYLGHGNPNVSGTYQTNDGSHITFAGLASYGGTITYKDGTNVTVSVVNNNLLPTQILDRNGNYIQIAYKDSTLGYSPLAIDFIADTMGRLIQFNYTNYDLVSITAPAEGTGTRTVAQFDYQDHLFKYTFSGINAFNAPTSGTNVSTLRHIYNPPTGTGYLLTYSDYGMAYNVSLRRQLTGNGSDGIESAAVSFNYPTSGMTVLGDAPAFTQRTESATSATTGTWSYATTADGTAQTKTVTITRPDSSTLALTRSTNTSIIENGLLTLAEVKNSSGASMARSVPLYVNDPGGSPQVQQVKSFDDAGVPTKVDFDYDQYGSIINRREYGFQDGGAWKVRRRTRTVYATIPGSMAVSLVSETDLYDAQLNTNDADDILIAKTTFTYDNYTAMQGLEDYAGTANPPGHYSSYNATATNRGNVTGVTKFIEVAAGTTIQHLAKYDIFGSVTKAQVSCCQEKDFTFTDATNFGQGESIMSGDPTGVHETVSDDPDFNTNLAVSTTDAGGLTTNYGYDGALNPISATLPVTGTSAAAGFDYANLQSTSSITYNDTSQSNCGGSVSKTMTMTTKYDGWGVAIQTIGPNGAQVNTNYDAMGRVTSKTNPFLTGGSRGPSMTFQYDALGRPTMTMLPDGNTTQAIYSGSVVTLIDQVSRKMRRQNDGLGRLITVTEQDSTGALVQDTTYTYSLMDKLTGVNQANQTRTYKYDALGRLLYEKIPEQSPTINDGTGTYWTCKYTYTDFNAVATKQDARGALITYGYDALHRQVSVTYNTMNAPGVVSTPPVTVAYTAWGAPSSITVGSEYTETYTFDPSNRVTSETKWILGSVYDTRKIYTTNYEYNGSGQRTKITYPSGNTVGFSYDNYGRLSGLPVDPNTPCGANYLSAVAYNIAGQVTGLSLGNSVVETYSFDANRAQVVTQTAAKAGTSLINLTYNSNASAGQMGAGTTAGNAGQLMSISGTINGTTESATFTYDLVNRLATSNQVSNGSAAQRRFAYDRWGNRTGVWDAVSGGNQIQTVTLEQSAGVPTNRITSVTTGSTVSYVYDSAGNLTSDGVHSYQYDGENRLVSVDNGATATYRYDQKSRRITKIIGSTWTHYIWEGGQVVAEHDGTTPYSTNPAYQVASARFDYVIAGGRLVYSRQRSSGTGSWTSEYYVFDRLSKRLVLDASGAVAGRQGHLAYGEDWGGSGAQEKHHFTSYERDGESGADYAYHRYASSTVGRFNSVDGGASTRKEMPQSWNRYSYTAGDPVNRIDPSGLVYFGFVSLCQPEGWSLIQDFLPGSQDSPFDPPVCFDPLPTRSYPDPVSTEGPPCIIHASFSGPITAGVALPNFPDRSRMRGLTVNDPEVYPAWNTEISFSVKEKDNVANWTISQTARAEFSGLWIVNGKVQEFSRVEGPGPDPISDNATFPQFKNIKPSDKWRFWIDAPGPLRNPSLRPWTGTFKIDLVSTVTNQAGLSCSRAWHVVFRFTEGRLDFTNSNAWEDQ